MKAPADVGSILDMLMSMTRHHMPPSLQGKHGWFCPDGEACRLAMNRNAGAKEADIPKMSSTKVDLRTFLRSVVIWPCI